MIRLEYQNIKTFFLKDTLQISMKKFFWLKKLETLLHGHMLLMILMMKKLLEYFMKKELQETGQQKFRIEKVIKRKGNKLNVLWKD